MQIAQFTAELTDVPVRDDRFALWRVVDLERHVDRAALCTRAREWARKTFAWEAIGKSMRDAYAQAISPTTRRVA